MFRQNSHQQSEQKHTILYIEDDLANRQLLEFIFAQRQDLCLIEAENGSTGIQMAIDRLPSVILLDLSLPDMDGYTVLHRLQQHDFTSHIPVIAISGNSLPEDIAKGMAAGMQGYLTKPVKIMEMYTLIDRTLGIIE